MDEIEQINLYDAGITLTTDEPKPAVANVWMCDHLKATMTAGGITIEMARKGKRIIWYYSGSVLVRWRGLPIS